MTKIYGADTSGQIQVGRLAGAESIPVRIDLDRMITRHSAVLGSTGSGKSTTVISLLRALCDKSGGQSYPSSRIMLLDIHGEYGNALKSVAKVYRVAATDPEDTALAVPFWALDPLTLIHFLMGPLDSKSETAIVDKIQSLKLEALSFVSGVDPNALTINTPVPYSLKRLWFELVDPEVKTWADKDRVTPAIVDVGDAETLKVPTYKAASPNNTVPYQNQQNVLGIRRQLAQMPRGFYIDNTTLC